MLSASVSEQVCTIAGVEFPYNKIQLQSYPLTRTLTRFSSDTRISLGFSSGGRGVLKYFRREDDKFSSGGDGNKILG